MFHSWLKELSHCDTERQRRCPTQERSLTPGLLDSALHIYLHVMVPQETGPGCTSQSRPDTDPFPCRPALL